MLGSAMRVGHGTTPIRTTSGSGHSRTRAVRDDSRKGRLAAGSEPMKVLVSGQERALARMPGQTLRLVPRVGAVKEICERSGAARGGS